MRDLAAYRPVSSMPPVTRDLSVAVAADEETLGEQVREALGADAACVEEVRVLAATPYDALRDRIYLAIHQGTQYQWAVTSSP